MPKSKGRILCTEDDEDTRDLLSHVLTEAGYKLACTDNFEDAIALAKTHYFDLFLLDNWMPELSGVDLTKKLREFDIKTPILFYSAAAYQSDKDAAKEAGAQGYLVKPVSEDALIK